MEDMDGGFWLYLESNDHPGLQQGGVAWHAIGTGTALDTRRWDRDTRTGELIDEPDTVVL